jgi:putative Mg2+ transporter-C (MgtC) family protein
MHYIHLLIDLVLLLIVGAVIGNERETAHGIIGKRSVTLVLLGSFIFTLISTFVGGDPSRIIAQVVSGTGFIGAGLIFKRGADSINNVTTAILIWCLSALGCLIGLSHRIEAIIITAVIMIVLKYYKKLFDNEKG